MISRVVFKFCLRDGCGRNKKFRAISVGLIACSMIVTESHSLIQQLVLHEKAEYRGLNIDPA